MSLVKLDQNGFCVQVVECYQAGTEGMYADSGFIEAPSPPSFIHRYVSGEWVVDAATQLEIAKAVVLAKRSAFLSSSDWTQLPDVPLETKEEWATYRQALRDITEQPGYPTDITWPERP